MSTTVGTDATTVPSTVPPSSTTTSTDTTSTLPRRDGWYLVWVTARLPDGFAEGLASVPGVDLVSVVRMGNGHLVETRDAVGRVVDTPPSGFVIPVETHAFDPGAHAEFVPPDVARILLGLDADEAALGTTSAAVRRLGVGATLVFESGAAVKVAAIIDDRWVGDAEVVTTRADASDLGGVDERYVVLHHTGDRPSLEEAISRLTEEKVQIKAEGETLVFRYGDVVRSQAAIKGRFGEFAYRVEGDRFTADPQWVADNIVTEEVPLLGSITCHRDFADTLHAVMEDLEASGLGEVIDAGAYAGCWNSRFIAGRRDLSHHAWGIAADINFFNDAGSVASPGAPELIEAMARAGITSGRDWVNPDPGHYEWYGQGLTLP